MLPSVSKPISAGTSRPAFASWNAAAASGALRGDGSTSNAASSTGAMPSTPASVRKHSRSVSGGKATATAPLNRRDNAAACARSAVTSMTARPLPAATSRANSGACSVSMAATTSPRATVGDLHGAPATQLVDGSVERQRSGIAVDFLYVFHRSWQKACVSKVLGYQLRPVHSVGCIFRATANRAQY